MSRIGRLPVKIPKGVKVTIKEGQVLLESPKGKVVQDYAPEVSVKTEGDLLTGPDCARGRAFQYRRRGTAGASPSPQTTVRS